MSSTRRKQQQRNSLTTSREMHAVAYLLTRRGKLVFCRPRKVDSTRSSVRRTWHAREGNNSGNACKKRREETSGRTSAQNSDNVAIAEDKDVGGKQAQRSEPLCVENINTNANERWDDNIQIASVPSFYQYRASINRRPALVFSNGSKLQQKKQEKSGKMR